MPVSGLLLTLNESPELRSGAVAAMLSRPDLTVGAASGRWLPVALEAEDDSASRAAHDWLAALPGVDFVDVVHVSFESDLPDMESAASIATHEGRSQPDGAAKEITENDLIPNQ